MSTYSPEFANRVKGGIVYALVLAAATAAGFWAPVVTFFLFLAGAVVMCLEMLRVLKKRCASLPLWLAPFGVVPLLSVFLFPRATDALVSSLLLLGMFMLLASVLRLIRTGPEGLPGVTAAAAVMLYVFGSFSVLGPLLFDVPRGLLWFSLALLAPAVCDVFAYAGGKHWGRRRIVPHLSPKKTWAGTVTGTVGTVLFCLICFLTLLRPARFSTGQVLLLSAGAGVCLSLFAQAGDWIASAVKRYAGVKDFSKIIRGHGGLFDRLDSFLTVLPVVFLLALWLERVNA